MALAMEHQPDKFAVIEDRIVPKPTVNDCSPDAPKREQSNLTNGRLEDVQDNETAVNADTRHSRTQIPSIYIEEKMHVPRHVTH